MRRPRTRPAPRVGEGELRFSGQTGPADYVIHSDAKLRSGAGALIGDTDWLRSAFHAGQAKLKLDDGRDLDIVVIAHTEGGDRAYFEIARH
jgi:hypothetical protein